jgi:acetyl-CoA carboxylase carboxyl transferase subunit alpha
MAYDLEFEKPLADLEKRIVGMRKKGERLKRDEQEQLQKAEQDLTRLTQEIYSRLTDWQTVQVSRHKDRPHAIDFVNLMCDDFFEMHGDRTFGDNPTILGGPARLGGTTVMMLCHEKGRSLKEKRERNAGQAHPEGFRKAQRLMLQAEKFRLPVISLIDTPGASIALEDEERGQSTAIATSILQMAQLRVPIISTVIGEGGSGGALALGVADQLFMLEYTYFSVAAPESVASIIWRSTKFAAEAAEGQHISARRLHKLGLVDDLIPEPLGGAHQNHAAMAGTLKTILLTTLDRLHQFSPNELLARRYQKFRNIGVFSRAGAPIDIAVSAD